MNSIRPTIPFDRPLTDDEWANCLAWVLLYPSINPTLDWLSLGEFVVKLVGNDSGRITAFHNANGTGDAIQRRLSELCWQWTFLGFLVPYGEHRFTLTDWGRLVLAESWEEMASVLEPGGIVNRLNAIGFQNDEAISFYADEAQRCLRAGLYQSTIVMIGISAEALLTQLFDALSEVSGEIGSRRPPKTPSAKDRLDWLRDVLRDRRSQIRTYLASAGTSYRWLDDLPGLVLGVADVIRLGRNDAGHPSAFRVDRARAVMALAVFPQLARAVEETVSAIQGVEP